MKNKIIKIISILLLSGLLIGCGNSESKDSSSENTNGSSEIMNESQISEDSGNVNDVDGNIAGEVDDSAEENTIIDDRKIIMTGDIYFETNEFDKAIEKIDSLVKGKSGYIESSNIYGSGISIDNSVSYRSAYYVVKVPSTAFESTMEELKKIGVVINQGTTSEDVSSIYYDKEARLNTLKIQEERYLEILENATTVSDIVEIENSLSDVRYEIEKLTSYLKKMDSLVDLSTINISIDEVEEERVVKDDNSLIGKAKDTLIASFNSLKEISIGLILIIVAIVPYGVIIGIIIFIILYLRRIIKNKGSDNSK